MAKELLLHQERLWDRQHERRGTGGREGGDLLTVPNEAAVLLASALLSPSTILEIGSANGRDARFWASLGHTVHCVDFSYVALDQLISLSQEQGIDHRIYPYRHNIMNGTLPPHLPSGLKYSGFYARSALHVSDQALDILAANISGRMFRGAYIVIEGKTSCDEKISRSQPLGNGLMLDIDGHVRRVWTEKTMERLANNHCWQIITLKEIVDSDHHCSILRLIAKTG